MGLLSFLSACEHRNSVHFKLCGCSPPPRARRASCHCRASAAAWQPNRGVWRAPCSCQTALPTLASSSLQPNCEGRHGAAGSTHHHGNEWCPSNSRHAAPPSRRGLFSINFASLDGLGLDGKNRGNQAASFLLPGSCTSLHSWLLPRGRLCQVITVVCRRANAAFGLFDSHHHPRHRVTALSSTQAQRSLRSFCC